MDVKTYRARTMQEALALVRRELGPEAAVLQTREVRPGWRSLFGASRQIEVVASNEVNVPSRLTRRAETLNPPSLGEGRVRVGSHSALPHPNPLPKGEGAAGNPLPSEEGRVRAAATLESSPG